MPFVMPTDDELRARLTAEEYRVLREQGIEDPYTGDYLNGTPPGTFVCKVCTQPLFVSSAQFNGMTGWPSFDQALDGAVEEYESKWFEKPATGVKCTRCHSHLGHLFDRGITETGKRYSINSVCIAFIPNTNK